MSSAETWIDFVVIGLIIARPLCENLKFEKLSCCIILCNLISLSLLSVGFLAFPYSKSFLRSASILKSLAYSIYMVLLKSLLVSFSKTSLMSGTSTSYLLYDSSSSSRVSLAASSLLLLASVCFFRLRFYTIYCSFSTYSLLL